MHALLHIECRFNGPMDRDQRWALRFGSSAAYERARAGATLRYLRHEAARLVRTLAPSALLHEQVRALLTAAA